MWHDRTLNDVWQELGAHRNGLDAPEVARRLARFGPNILPAGKKIAWWHFLFEQFKSPLVYILLIAAGLTAFLNEWIDTVVILLAVAVNVAVGFWQEFHSQNILEKLRQIVPLVARVIRGSSECEINASELVPGDILVLKGGMRVAADARLIEAKNLKVNEAILTGESLAVKKFPGVVAEDAPVGDRTNMVHSGTVIERGEGTAMVVATGSATEVGKIALLTAKTEETPTPLQERIAHLGKILTILFSVAAVAIFVVGLVEAHSLKEMFTTAIAVAVAAIPEGLPAAIAIVLAISAQRIARSHGVTKRLLAAETLGSTSVICTDKTGTLTEGRMKVEKIITKNDTKRAEIILALANEAFLERSQGKIEIKGEVTDRAKLQAFLDGGGDFETLMRDFPRRAMIPFNPSYGFIASFHAEGRRTMMFVSGSPEAVIGRSALDAKKKAVLKNQYERLMSEGYRLIALGEREIFENIQDVDVEEESARERLVRELTFVGFAAMRDPVREDVKFSVTSAREAGIRVVMVTGDHKLTAIAIGKALGFSTAEDAHISGEAIDRMSDKDLEVRIQNIEIVSRVNPAHKARIVRALKAHDHVVAMTGDGVNDAPALKAADIGIAVGSGSDIAKEASDLVLLDDGFSTIVAAIREGRIAFDNIRKVTVFLLAGSFTELLAIISALLFRIPLPFSAVQILWMNLVEDALPNIALSFDPGERGVMRRAPLKRGTPILDSVSKSIIFILGIGTDVILIGFFVALFYFSGLSLEHIRTFMFAAVGLDFVVYAYAVKSWREPIWKTSFFDNPLLVAAAALGIGLMLAAIYAPFLRQVLDTVPLALRDWGIIIALGAVKLFGIEAIKWWFFGRRASAVATSVV